MWDARLTSELILLFLYLGFMALQAAIDDPRRADKAGAVLALVGVDQRADHLFLGEMVEHAAPGRVGEPDARPDAWPSTMLLGMLLMALAFWMYSIAATLMRVRCHHSRARAQHRLGQSSCRSAQHELGQRSGVSSRWAATAGYVWGSYGVTAACIAVEIAVLITRRRAGWLRTVNPFQGNTESMTTATFARADLDRLAGSRRSPLCGIALPDFETRARRPRLRGSSRASCPGDMPCCRRE